MDRVYIAVRSVAAPVSTMLKIDQSNSAIMIVSSAIRLVVGGKAIFMRLANNHQVAINGKIGCRLRVSSRIRLCVRS